MWDESKAGLVVLPETGKVTVSQILPPQGVVAIARIDGASATDSDGVFSQFSTAFKFPAWFGWNWNALSDCLRDLAWLPADRYLVVIEEPVQLLAEDSSYRQDVFRILAKAAKYWASPLGKPGNKGIQFQSVLVAKDGEIDQLRTELGDYI